MKVTMKLRLGIVLIGAAALGGCTTVQPWQRGRLADQCMTFDSDASRIAYEAHWLEAREGSAGGYGIQSGGCGCK
jgi:hypothetical protein